MNYWHVYAKATVKQGASERTVPQLMAEGLLLGQSKTASGLLYWNGKRYVWYQQGD